MCSLFFEVTCQRHCPVINMNLHAAASQFRVTLRDGVQQGAMFGFKVRQPPPVDTYYDTSPFEFGDYEARVHHTPGHCPGGVCLEIGRAGESEKHLFVGDTLFAGSIGRTDLPGGNYGVLMRSITEVLFPLGDEAIVHPGHGPDTTIGRERTTNPFVLEYLKSG